MPFHLHPQIDVDALTRAYRAQGRVTVAPFIIDEEAERLRAHLAGRSDWRLRMRGEGTRIYDFPRLELDQWDPAKVEALRSIVAPKSEEVFSYSYERIVISDEQRTLREEGTLLADFAAFLSSREVVDLVAGISGQAGIGFADSFASRYAPGDYLTIHDDLEAGSNRLAAYVFGLTPRWRPEWGGLLLFHERSGNVEAGLSPRFNVLALFAVPKRHSVALVAPFAPVPRLSITGWFRSLPTVPE